MDFSSEQKQKSSSRGGFAPRNLTNSPSRHRIVGGSLASFERIGAKAGQLAPNVLGITQGPENTPAVLALLKREVFLRGITIEVHLDPHLPPVVGDRVQLQQVILNLVLNAADAMADIAPESRRLIIRTEREEDGKARVAVRDFGTGLDGQNLHRLFEPFYSTKPEGLGMGLAISRSIVEAHGGRLWAANNPDRGATFMFTTRISQRGEA